MNGIDRIQRTTRVLPQDYRKTVVFCGVGCYPSISLTVQVVAQ